MRSHIHLLSFITLFLFTNASLFAQSKTLDFERFDGLTVSGNIELILIPDSENYAEIEVENTELDKLETKRKGSTLKFKLKNKGFFNLFGSGGKAYIKLHYTENLIDISTSASADILSNNIVLSDDLSLSSSSGSTIDIEIECNSIDASASSGADIRLTGSCDEQDVSTSSGGTYKAQKILSSKVIASASSGGSIKLWATEKIKGRASSGGSIHYKGNPSISNISSSSGGSIRNVATKS